jgi:hypothetical protein
MRFAAFLLTAVLLAAAPAAAQDAPETSGNVKFLENNPYPLKYDMPAMEGTDLEFGTITVQGATPAKPGAPGTPATPATPPVKPISSKAKKNDKRYAACVKKAKKRFKGKRKSAKRAKAIKACKRKHRSKQVLRSLADVSADRAGIQRTYAFAGSYTNGLHIYDVSDPADPQLVTHYDCAISQGDVQVFQRKDLGGRWFVAYASDGPADNMDSACVEEADAAGANASERTGSGTFIIEVTNPAAPKTVSFVYYEKGSHNQTVHPSGKYLYNSNSDIVAFDPVEPGIEYTDITDITKPKDLGVFGIVPLPGLGSNAHDIWFNADGSRAYVAAVTSTIILDTSDPTKPKQVSRIPNEYNVSHQAETLEAEIPGLGKRTVLIVADEFAGAQGTNQCPNGGLHVYDVSPNVEAVPVRLGYFNITMAGPTDVTLGRCTAHVFQLHREQGLMTIGWYNAGFRVLDIKELAGVSFGAQGTGIKDVGFGRWAQGEAWAAKTPRASDKEPFTVYTNDTIRGFDAWQVDPSKPATRSSGQSLKFEFIPAAREVARRVTAAPAGTSFVCDLGATR